MEQTSRGIDSITSQAYIQRDIDAVRYIFDPLTPTYAWDNAVSGNTAARTAGIGGPEWEETAEIIAKAAAYGWWPQETPDGGYIAVPIDKWVADGHPFTKIVPDLATMLDRWGIAPVVIEGTVEHSPRRALPGKNA
jgi:hypothetical protein